MSWRGRDERGSRWESQGQDRQERWAERGRSPVWDMRRDSPERARREPHHRDSRDRYERYDRDPERYERDPDRDRDRRERYERDERRALAGAPRAPALSLALP